MRSRLPLVFLACIAGAAAQPVRFALAIVRADGAIVPFAAYDDGRWERAWPDAGEAAGHLETINATDSVWRKRGERVPRTWTVWPATRGASIQTRVNGIDVVAAHCHNQVALTSGLRPISCCAAPKSSSPTVIPRKCARRCHWRRSASPVLGSAGARLRG